MEYAVLLLILACVCVGVVSAVVTTWRLKSTLLEVLDRLALVEGICTREVKVRAAQERWKRPDKDAALLDALKTNSSTPTRKANWWESLPKSG
jgi:hypothetical protein